MMQNELNSSGVLEKLKAFLFCFLFCFSIFIALLLEAGGLREVTETTTSPLLHSQICNTDIQA